MCGIWAVISKDNIDSNTSYQSYNTIKERGPDKSCYIEYNSPFHIKLGFHRLSIMDLSSHGDQPFTYETNDRIINVI